MTPGSTIIKKCSACSKLIEQHTCASGNTFGAIIWTDGKREAHMLPDQPWLVICPHCHEPLWIDELEKLGEAEPLGDERDKFKDAREYKKPSQDDYFGLLANGIAELKKERYVRLCIWWAGNDERRNNTCKNPMSSREVANVTAFAQTLDESDANDLVMKAEAMRELGRFDDALLLLAKSSDKRIAQAVGIIRSLSEKRDSYVREMHFK